MLYLQEQNKKYRLIPIAPTTDITVHTDPGTLETTIIFSSKYHEHELDKDEIKALAINLTPSQRSQLKAAL